MSRARPVLIVRGQAKLIDGAAAADLERVRQLLDDLEGKQEIARLLDSAREGACDADVHRRRRTSCSRFRDRR